MRRRSWALPLVAFIALVAPLAALFSGPSGLSGSEVLSALRGSGADAVASDIVFTVRLPRVVLAWLVGAALGLSGALFQGLLRNDLAEPYLLGVGPGALLGVTSAALFVGHAAGGMPSPWVRAAGAFLGAVTVALLIFSFARRTERMPTVSVLLAGIAVGAFVHAVATALLHARVPDWHRVVRWMLGDLSLAGYAEALMLAGLLALALIACVWRARDLDLLALGDEAAFSGGVDVRRGIWLFGGLGCLLAALAVAHVGLIGFVGLVVPHLARLLIGAPHGRLLPAATLLGAGLLVAADALSRVALSPRGLPVGVVTALLGAPVLAVLILRRT